MAQILLDTVDFATVPVTYTATHNLSTDDANWVSAATTFNPAIVSTPNGGVNQGEATRTGFTWTNDQWAQVTMVIVPTSFAGVGLRFQAATAPTGYFCGASPGSFSRYRIFRYDAGALISLAFTLRDPTAGDTINGQIVGTVITLNINSGLEIITYDTSTGNDGGTPGSPDSVQYSTGNVAVLGNDTGSPTAKVVSTWTAGSVGAPAGLPPVPAKRMVSVIYSQG